MVLGMDLSYALAFVLGFSFAAMAQIAAHVLW
jgi:hypothetical protein